MSHEKNAKRKHIETRYDMIRFDTEMSCVMSAQHSPEITLLER